MTPDADDAQRMRQAFDWLVRLRHNEAPELRQQFEHWRRQDARHERAWLQASGLQAELAQEFGGLPRGTVDALEHSAVRLQRRRALKTLTLGLALGGSAWLARDLSLVQPLLADQATGLGERRRLALADGSALHLNTDSAVDLPSGASQGIELRRGELFVERREDALLALQVRTPQGHFILYPGARCDLRLGPGNTCLSVEQGQVEWLHAPAERIGAGERRRFDAQGSHPLADDGLDPGAWRDGVIVSRDTRLDVFLAELARYRSGHLGCSDEVAGLSLSGVFRLSDTDALLAVVADTLPVRLRYLTRWWVNVEAAT